MPELSSDILNILLAHDTWGTRKLLELCRPLSHEQFHRKFEIGLGSLHETLTHMVSTMRRWADRLENRPPRPALHKIAERPDIPTELACARRRESRAARTSGTHARPENSRCARRSSRRHRPIAA